MQLYTGRYPRDLPEHLAPIRISLGYPRFKLRYELFDSEKLFAPSRSTFGIDDEEEFRYAYRLRLDNREDDALHALRILEQKAEAAGFEGLILLCFEDIRGGKKWCHRRMLAEWLEDKLGVPVPELPEDEPPGPAKVATAPATIQETLLA